MSLYIGHLPPNVRPEDLERVFQRFGRCNVRLKDGYGFVIFDVTSDAEKALRKMRGKIICGEYVSLNWSNKQPKPFQRPERQTKVYEPFHRVFHNRRDFNGSRYCGDRHLDDVLEKETEDVEVDDSGSGKGVSLKEGVMDEGGEGEVDPVENDRWGEPAQDKSTGRELENASDLDHYEPYRGHSEKDWKENNHTSSSSRSNENGRFREKGYRGHSVNDTERNFNRLRPPLSCYNCGIVGHIMRLCPNGGVRGDKFRGFKHRREELNFRGRDEGRVKRLRYDSWERSNSCNRRLRNWIGSYSRKPRKESKSESFSDSNERSRRKSRSKSEAKKKKLGIKKKVLKRRRGRRSGSSSLSSDSSTASLSSNSKSSTSDASSSSSLRSPSSQSRSSSSKSGSVSPRSKSLRSRSRSSLLGSLSLSVSLDEKKSSSSKDSPISVSMVISPKGKPENIPMLEPKHPLNTNNLENSEPIDKFPASKDDDTKEMLISCETNCSTRISTKEMLLALRHYGLPIPEEGNSGFSVEGYFGAARLWPWEMIYYRRLKKGPISTENYTRRLEQNKQFGIIDKYIRSSSGWGECCQVDA